MGADYLQASIPDIQYTPERINELNLIVDCLTEDEFFDDESCDRYDDASEWRSELRDAIQSLPGIHEWRSVIRDHGRLITGGMSWGDDPTAAFTVFETINKNDKLESKLAEWAAEDKVVPKQWSVLYTCEGRIYDGGPFATEAEAMKFIDDNRYKHDENTGDETKSYMFSLSDEFVHLQRPDRTLEVISDGDFAVMT